MMAPVAILVLLLGAALQVRLPAMLGFRVELLPALVAYAALTFPCAGVLALALVAGFLHDALSAGPFGVSPAVYAATAWLIYRLGTALNREMTPLQMVAGALVALTGGIAGCLFAGWQAGHLYKLAAVTLTSALVTPVAFALLDRLGCQPGARR